MNNVSVILVCPLYINSLLQTTLGIISEKKTMLSIEVRVMTQTAVNKQEKCLGEEMS